ncbi:hypothetical protein [Paractinoplanes globisporus]|uniref:Uncharacterized protein n=1 Tax=Paractinoplanes globisporus TaxID=113565 RepID=A0ABW6WSX3_9ACTN|nr:hypothetical protein [Actinoplanes globisporus]
MAGHQLIDDHLADLARRLPPDAVDELADGLLETWQCHRSAGLPPAEAARAAIAEFGSPAQITAAFVRQSPGRRAARLLLMTGPLVGVCWGAGLGVSRAWTWPAPVPVAAGFGLALLIVVAALAVAATSRRSYRRTRLAALGGAGLVVLDAAALAAVLLLAPAPVWPMLPAIPASLARIGLTLHALPRVLTDR